MEYTVDTELKPGMLVGDTQRIVMMCTKLSERIPGDSYAGWVAICYEDGALHPYVVWDVYARPEGWSAGSGQYYQNLMLAEIEYVKRGGSALTWEVMEL